MGSERIKRGSEGSERLVGKEEVIRAGGGAADDKKVTNRADRLWERLEPLLFYEC